jgi:hypothetical protein
MRICRSFVFSLSLSTSKILSPSLPHISESILCVLMRCFTRSNSYSDTFDTMSNLLFAIKYTSFWNSVLPPKNEQILFARTFYDVSAPSILRCLPKKTRLKCDLLHFETAVKFGCFSSNSLTTLLPSSILYSNLIGS